MNPWITIIVTFITAIHRKIEIRKELSANSWKAPFHQNTEGVTIQFSYTVNMGTSNIQTIQCLYL